MAGLSIGSDPTDGSIPRSLMSLPDGKPKSLLGGRYTLFGEIASGGMATVHFGRLSGPAGFARTVAIKRLHPQLAREPELASMFLDEVRVAARIHHPNVVATLDTVEDGGELFLVMEYVDGESLAQLLRLARSRGALVPPAIASTIACGLLHGLHAAHEATGEQGQPLHIIHRDVSPQNAMVGADGVTRVLDFGIARAVGRLQTTRQGQLKGKVAYLAPERIHGRDADRRSDIYGAAVVLWETLTGAQLFDGDSDVAVLAQVVAKQVEPPSAIAPGISEALDAITMRGLERDPDKRFSTAREMALAIQQRVGVVASSEVGDWVSWIAADRLARRGRALALLERFGVDDSRSSGLASGKEPVPTRIRVEPSTRVLPMQLPAAAHGAPADRTDAAAEAFGSTGPSLGSDQLERSPFKGGVRLAGLMMALAVATAALVALWPPSQSRLVKAQPIASVVSTPPIASVVSTPPIASVASAQPIPPVAPNLAVAAVASSGPDSAPVVSTASGRLTSAASAPGARTSSDDRRRPKPVTPRALPDPRGEASGKPPEPAHAIPAEPEARPPPPPRNPCHPPYTIDSAGVKHFKVDCIVDGRQ